MEITLQASCMEEIEQLNVLYEAANSFFGSMHSDPQVTPPETCIKQGCLPPNGVFEKYRILSIYADDEMIGYCDYYMGHPDDKTAYIGLIYIAEQHRNRGYANQVVDILIRSFSNEGFENVRLVVSLKNWIGIRFWVKKGFNTITLAKIHSGSGDDNYGELELQRTIKFENDNDNRRSDQ